MAALVGLLSFAVLRAIAAMRDLRGQLRESRSEELFVAAALEEALGTLRAQERAMSARAEASERLSAEIVASLTSGLVVVGLDRRVRTLNAAGRRLLAVPAGAPLDERFDALVATAPALAALVEECLQTATPIVRRAIDMPAGSSPATHLGVTVSPLFDGAGELQGAVGLFTDLSSVVALEQQLRLKDSLARLGELTAGLAHEFRNGLATIHGYGRLIDPDRLPSDYRPYLEGIRAETDSLGAIVAKFLDFARPAALTLSPIALGPLARRVAEEFRAAAEAPGGGIDVRGDFATIDGDELLLRQALSNILQNALQACESAGVVPAITIDACLDSVRGMVRMTIRDNGPGIAPGIRDAIFQPFFTSRGHGTGLGLALVQKIVVSHGGRVSAGAPPSGAAIEIELPLPQLSA